ncbi:MAG: hypothetical protein AB7O38_03700 [Pirellulaceae bacterium]
MVFFIIGFYSPLNGIRIPFDACSNRYNTQDYDTAGSSLPALLIGETVRDPLPAADGL